MNQFALKLIHNCIKDVVTNSPAELYFDFELSEKALRMYRLLIKNGKYVREENSEYLPCCMSSNESLARELNISKISAIRHIAELKNKEYIDVTFKTVSKGTQREIVIKRGISSSKELYFCFGHYRRSVQFKLLKQAYEKYYSINFPEQLEKQEIEFNAVLDHIEKHGFAHFVDSSEYAQTPTVKKLAA
jgi:hypothetical protein